MKPKKCRVCGYNFVQRSSTHVACDLECAKILAIAVRKKAEEKLAAVERKADKVKREKLKTRSQWIAEAQAAVNRVARLRDIRAGHGCISCGASYQEGFGGAFDGGHYRSVGAAPHLRFYLPQISLQCVKCNRYLGGNATEARKGLVLRHGVAWVEAIEAMQGTGKWSIDYLQRLKRVMTKKAGRLEKIIRLRCLP